MAENVATGAMGAGPVAALKAGVAERYMLCAYCNFLDQAPTQGHSLAERLLFLGLSIYSGPDRAKRVG